MPTSMGVRWTMWPALFTARMDRQSALRHIFTRYELLNYIRGGCSLVEQIVAAKERGQAHDR